MADAPTIILLGKNGQLGWELHRALLPAGRIVACDYPEIDLTRPETWRPMLERERPQVVINATAYTNVDKAESEPELAMALNAHAPGLLAQACKGMDAALIHISTDYVFDGSLGRPYTESDPVSPIGAYARSKAEGERQVAEAGAAYLTLRTAWLYSLRRESFVTKVLSWARRQETLHIVDDQVSNPTWARHLAEIIAAMLAVAGNNPAGWLHQHRGLYNIGGGGYASRYTWAQAILRAHPHPEELRARQVLPAKTADFPTPAHRPLYTPLDCSLFCKTFGVYLPDWQEILPLALQND
jgi:dTDP-4-dehydrorhamnose reductase